MGHRLELYVSPELASELIHLSESFGIAAQIVGRVEAHNGKKVTIVSPYGTFEY
jgi:phosphoribosylformylglycinamidine cyclo-ligase